MVDRLRRFASPSSPLRSHRWTAIVTTLVLLLTMLPSNLVQPAAAQGDGETYSISVRKYDCPPGYDAYNANLNGLFQNCTTPQPGIPFSVTTDNGYYQGDTRNTGADGGSEVSWTGIPLESTFTLQEQIPDGYGLPMIACAAYASHWDGNAGVQFPNFSYGQGNISAYIDSSYAAYPYIDCYWFNVPAPGEDPNEEDPDDNGGYGQNGAAGTITIEKYACWVDYSANYPNSDDEFNYLSDNCALGFPGVRYSVGYGNDQPRTVDVDQNGYAAVDDYPGGQLYLAELPSYWPHALRSIVYCSIGESSDYELMSFDQSGRISGDYPSGTSIYCRWFNVFIQGGIEIVKYGCPDHVDAAGSDWQNLLQECAPLEGVEFDIALEHSSDPSNDRSATGLTGGDGRFGYYDGPLSTENDAQTYTKITEIYPPEYESAKVYCSVVQWGQYPGSIAERSLVSADSIEFEYGSRDTVTCAWFNFETPAYDEYGRIVIYKHVCPEGYPQSGSYDDYVAACANSVSGSGYEFTAENGSYSESNTTDNQGVAEWEQAPAGNVRIFEAPAPGYQPYRVYCSTQESSSSDEPDDWTEAPLSGSSIEYALAEGWTIYCHWFNAPAYGGTVTIYKYECPTDYDGASTYHQDYIDNCSEQDGMEFDLSGPDGYEETQAVANGYAQWDKTVPYGDLTIREIPPSGYATWRVFCGVYQDDPSEVSSYDETTYNQNAIDWQLDEGYNLICYWFNMPAYYGTVTIYKYECPTDYDGSSTYHQDYIDNCSEQDGMEFDLSGPDGYEETQAVANGYAQWDKTVPYGDLTIREIPPSGYATWRVFCGVYQDDPSEVSSYDETTYNQNAIDWQLDEGYNLICYWFNIPYDDYGWINVFKFYCDGYDAQNVSREYLVSYCSPEPDVEFVYAGDSQLTDSNGEARWDQVQAGEVELQEIVRPGYRPFVVYCSTYPIDSNPEDYEQYDLSQSWQIDHELEAGYALDCYWFNEPYDDYGWIEIYKYVCDEGYDQQNVSREYLVSYCAPEQDVEFWLDDPSADQSTDSDGYVRWDQVEGGTYTLQEAPQAGYRPFRVYCSTYPYDESPSDYDPYGLSDDWSIEHELEDGYSLTCYWFNEYHEDTSTITVYKYLCPDDYDHSSLGYDYLVSYCNDPHADIDFDVWHGSDSYSGTTDVDGYYEWSDIPSGELEIREYAPAGYTPLRVYCAVYDPVQDETGDYERMQLSGGRIDYDLPAGYDLICYWFNEPYVDTGYGTVTIYKYACPESYDPSTINREYLLTLCEDAHEGVSFDLGWGDQTAPTQTVGDDGSVQWEEVPGGALKIAESSPDEYRTLAIYCSAYPYDGGADSWEGVSTSDGRTIDYHLPEGYSLVCYWFNAPYDYGTVTIYKYLCPADYDHHSVSQEYLESYCTEPQGDVEYELTTELGSLRSKGGVIYFTDPASPEANATSNDGIISWEEVPGGGYQVREVVPTGFETLRVYCTASYPSGGDSGWETMAVEDGASIYYDLAPGYSLTCYWYNAPLDGGWIEIVKYGCPEGYDPTHANEQDLSYACGERLEAVHFDLVPSGENASAGTGQSTDEDGAARWDTVDYGVDYDLIETYPSDYNSSIVYCSKYQPDYGYESDYEPYGVSNGKVSVWLEHGEYLKCRWYNLATDYGVYITITKYVCAVEAWDYDREQLREDCQDWQHGVRFYADSANGRVSGSTSSSGEVGWEGLPAGVIRLEESPPTGYGNRIKVYCRIEFESDPGEESAATVYDGIAVEYGLTEGQHLYCDWYNFPVEADGAWVTVSKYLCPANASTHSASRTSLKSKCTPLSGVRFSLAASGKQAISRITSHSGNASWEAVPAGEIGLAERSTTGYAPPVIYCAIGDGTAERVLSSGNSIQYEVADGDELHCDWFNIPKSTSGGTGGTGGTSGTSGSGGTSGTGGTGGTGGNVGQGGTGGNAGQGGTGGTGGTGGQPQGDGPASLTIIKFVCPGGYDLDDADADPERDCDPADYPIVFSLATWSEAGVGDEETQEGDSPDLNEVSFDNLEPGQFIVTEILDEDQPTAWAFVLSCDSSLSTTDNTRFYPLAITGTKLDLRLELYPGESLTCEWYNVPLSNSTVSFTVYECPGQVANPSRCDVAEDTHEISFALVDSLNQPVAAESDEDGEGSVELSPGTYRVGDADGRVCLVDSLAVDDDGNLPVTQSEDLEADIYTCG